MGHFAFLNAYEKEYYLFHPGPGTSSYKWYRSYADKCNYLHQFNQLILRLYKTRKMILYFARIIDILCCLGDIAKPAK